MNFNSQTKKVFKCDLCDGEPSCVMSCVYKALEYLDVSEQSSLKQKATAEKLTSIMHKITSALAHL